MKNKQIVTLKDIANKCNVSSYTVSRALNGKSDISPKTKEFILNTAKEMGYITNVHAKNLRVGKTNNIALIYDDFLNPYYSILIKNVSNFLNEKNYRSVLYYDFDSITKLNYKLMMRLISENVDGIISFIEVTKEAFDLAKKYNKPIVQIGSQPSVEIDCVYLDDFQGGKLATSYLIKHDKKHIAFLNSSKSHKTGIQRLNGYLECLKEHNIEIDKDLIIHLDESSIDPLEALTLFLNKNVDSIVCFNDSSAYTLLRQLKKMNIEDIEVVGFDNIKEVFPTPIEIHSVYGNMPNATKIAVEHLLKLINGESQERLLLKLPVKIN